jgi:type IV pilus assembly protein PilN
VFEELVRSTPDGVFFRRLESKGNSISISAQADKAASISDFLRNLDSSPWFDNTFMQKMESIKEGQEVVGHRFELKLNRVNPLKQEEDEG